MMYFFYERTDKQPYKITSNAFALRTITVYGREQKTTLHAVITSRESVPAIERNSYVKNALPIEAHHDRFGLYRHNKESF